MPLHTRTFSLEEQPELFVTTTATSRAVRGLLAERRIRHVQGRLYTKNLDDPLPAVLRRRPWDAAAAYFPGAVISDRTAFDMRPAGEEGSVFLCGETARVVRLPGLVLNCRRGPGAVAGDQPFLGGVLHLSSHARRFLDNMRPSRARTGTPRTLSRAEIEERVAEILSRRGDDELNELREQARAVATELGAHQELDDLERLIGTLLGTRDAPLASAGARAAAAGLGWDDRRLPLFDALMAELHAGVFERRDETASGRGSTFAFYEAYFSNFIEGTEFTLEEAGEIVFEGAIPPDRPADAHDVLGTFDLVSDSVMRRRTPRNAADLEEVLKAFHRRIMQGRPEALPGVFKEKPNRVGGSEFVLPKLVRGTLQKGWERYASLDAGAPRAMFALFLASEVHPFADGNGRVSRALANAELSEAGQQRIIIPTVLRDDYLQALRALTRDGRPRPLTAVFERAQAWAHEVDWTSLESARRDLERTNALLTSAEADERGVILRLPSEVAER